MIVVIGILFIPIIFYNYKFNRVNNLIHKRFASGTHLNNLIKYEYFNAMINYYKIPPWVSKSITIYDITKIIICAIVPYEFVQFVPSWYDLGKQFSIKTSLDVSSRKPFKILKVLKSKCWLM